MLILVIPAKLIYEKYYKNSIDYIGVVIKGWENRERETIDNFDGNRSNNDLF